MNPLCDYYFVGAALPPLTLGEAPELSFVDLKILLNENLREGDLQKVAAMLRPIDVANIAALWLGLPLDERGNFSAKELEEALLVREQLPVFVGDFLERYDSLRERLRYFASLYASLYRESHSGFVGQSYALEREVRLVLCALRSKYLSRDVARELQFEDPTDPFVADILAQKDAQDYIPPSEYEMLKASFERYKDDPKQLFQAELQFRFNKYEELSENQHFTPDRILNYLARLIIAESWDGLKSEEGRKIMEDLSKYE